jgi:hypothetical protein
MTYTVLCGTAQENALPDAYGPFTDIDDANEFLVPHRGACLLTDQAWLDDHDNADEEHYIVRLYAGEETP